MHPTKLPQRVIDSLMARRGRLHAFDRINPAKTALIVVDMQNAFCAPGAAGEVALAREIVPNINKLAKQMRAAGGVVVWVQMTIAGKDDWPIFPDALVHPDLGNRMLRELAPGSEGQKLWPAMEPDPSDMFVIKNRFSAFLPSACDLGGQLRQRGVDTVVIVGTLTHVCSESSARDAAMSDFKTFMVSDGNACRSDEDHLAALSTVAQVFGDVRSTDEIIMLLRAGTSAHATAAE
jgi:ureidoacrylate peracid hydrolase